MITIEHAKKSIRSNLGKLTMPALLLFLLPTTSYAQVGSGNLVYWAVGFFIFCLLAWVILTALVFRACLRRYRQQSMWKRLGLPVLFFFVPVLLVWSSFQDPFGGSIRFYTEITNKPVEACGVTFPPGSEAKYQQTGGFFGWRAKRTLTDIRSPHPVLLGNIKISGIIYIHNYCPSTARVILSENQTIDGWPCLAGRDVTITLTPSGQALRLCSLSEPHRWGEKLLPAGTHIIINGTNVSTDFYD